MKYILRFLSLVSTLAYYEHNATQLHKRYNGADVAQLHKQLSTYFSKGARILDVGCGSGRDANFMLSAGYDVLAIDASSAMVLGATNKFPGLSGRCYTVMIPNELSEIKQDSFDGIYSIAMLMHLKEDEIEKALLGFIRLLVGGGILFFSVCLSRGDKISDDFDRDGRRFTLREKKWWQTLCQSCGYVNIKSDITSDGLHREEIEWLNLLCEKPI